jgi:hypothetical protein
MSTISLRWGMATSHDFKLERGHLVYDMGRTGDQEYLPDQSWTRIVQLCDSMQCIATNESAPHEKKTFRNLKMHPCKDAIQHD